MNSKKVKLILFLMLALAVKDVAGQSNSNKLIINEKNIYVAGPTNALLLDTLIMEDNSTLSFSSKGQGTLIVKTAIIGKNCVISSKGNTLFHGEDGGNLSITINFESLTSLTIDARGGDGRRGNSGTDGQDGTPDQIERYKEIDSQGKVRIMTRHIPGTPAVSGSPGTLGGNGGKGGDVFLTYGTSGFIVNFNNSKNKNSITIKNGAGKMGVPGKRGNSGQSYQRGIVENLGKGNSDVEVANATDGKITLSQLQ